MSSGSIHNALLRPAVLQILRATGFNSTKPAVLDTVTDLAARYLVLLASHAAQNAFNNHNDYVPTVQDLRLALLDVGALRPQMTLLEERARGMELVGSEMIPFEDMRGIEGFINWSKGPVNKEIRRIAGLATAIAEVGGALDEPEDYVTALKKKHSKTGEESRYQGTILGKNADEQTVAIVGGPVGTIQEWDGQLRSKVISPAEATCTTTASSAISSVPLTPMDEDENETSEAGA